MNKVSKPNGIERIRDGLRTESFRDNHYSEKLYAKTFRPKIWFSNILLFFMWDNYKYIDQSSRS